MYIFRKLEVPHIDSIAYQQADVEVWIEGNVIYARLKDGTVYRHKDLGVLLEELVLPNVNSGVIHLKPGTYNVLTAPIKLKSYVYLVGAGRGATAIVSWAGEGHVIFNVEDTIHCGIIGMTITGHGEDAAIKGGGSPSRLLVLKNLKIAGVKKAIDGGSDKDLGNRLDESYFADLHISGCEVGLDALYSQILIDRVLFENCTVGIRLHSNTQITVVSATFSGCAKCIEYYVTSLSLTPKLTLIDPWFELYTEKIVTRHPNVTTLQNAGYLIMINPRIGIEVDTPIDMQYLKLCIRIVGGYSVLKAGIAQGTINMPEGDNNIVVFEDHINDTYWTKSGTGRLIKKSHSRGYIPHIGDCSNLSTSGDSDFEVVACYDSSLGKDVLKLWDGSTWRTIS